MTNPMNTNEDVKFLAENVLPYEFEVHNGIVTVYPGTCVEDESPPRVFNPYTNTDDFLEVVRAFPDNLKLNFEQKLPYELNMKAYYLDELIWLTDPKNRVAILTALTETLKQEKG